MKLRDGLKKMGVNEQWLCSKHRTPAEECLLAQLRHRATSRVSPPTVATSENIPAQGTLGPTRHELKRMKLRLNDATKLDFLSSCTTG